MNISNQIFINKTNLNINNNAKNTSFAGKKDSSDTLERSLQIKGKETDARIYTTNIDYKAYDQIREMCNHPAFRDLPIRIMPDVHPSKSTVVGFSAPMGDKIIPGILGSDIGCGMLCVKLDTQGQEIDFKKLDDVIHTYCSVKRTKSPKSLNKLSRNLSKEMNEVCKKLRNTSADYQESGLGTVGKGNHFIEIDEDASGQKYLIVHSGSRAFGERVAKHHQFIARQQNHYFKPELSYLTNDEAKAYLEDMKVVQEYAKVNRRMIADEILYRMGWKEKDSFESVHNYVEKDGIIRKGAISAHKGQKILIPLNMRDGVILATGKGNEEWNNTAPHGAGRKIPRGEAHQTLSLKEFENSMHGIYTTCVSDSTLDEAPAAYKNADEIIENIGETATVDEVIRPIYNFKD